MKRKFFIIPVILFSLFACDFSKDVEAIVDKGVTDAKVEMNEDISSAHIDLRETFNRVLGQSKDSNLSANAVSLYSQITMTSKYIDSLRMEMDKLDDMDIKNVEVIKDMFINNGIGDSVFNKVKRSYSLAIDIATEDKTRSRLREVYETFSQESKKQFFELNGPLGVNMILFGIESELIKDGTKSLAEHEN